MPDEEGLSLKAAFADAVLASRRLLEEAEHDLRAALTAYENSEVGYPIAQRELAVSLEVANGLRGVGEAQARLACALQHGAPGERF